MRQAGILAAACEYAIDHHQPQLVDDHSNARLLARGLDRLDGLSIGLGSVETNIIMVKSDQPASMLAQQAELQGLMFFPLNDHYFRLVTHRDVSRLQCEKAIEILSGLMQE